MTAAGHKQVVECDRNVTVMPDTVAAAMHGRKEDLRAGGWVARMAVHLVS